MKTIAIAQLKATLSANIKRVHGGEPVMILDHRRPVAVLAPLPSDIEYVSRSTKPYVYKRLLPLIATDPLVYLEEERGDR